MRLFYFPHAPNALKVQVVLLEKGIEAELVDVSNDREDFRAISPLGQVPALERDDGGIVTESLVVCRYIDGISGPPRLFGDREDEALTIAMWERRAEMALMNPAVEYGHQVHPMFAGRIEQHPAYAATLVPSAKAALGVFDGQLAANPFVAGERFTMADVTAMIGVLCWVGYQAVALAETPHVGAWFGRTIARPSMAPLRELMAMAAALTGSAVAAQ